MTLSITLPNFWVYYYMAFAVIILLFLFDNLEISLMHIESWGNFVSNSETTRFTNEFDLCRYCVEDADAKPVEWQRSQIDPWAMVKNMAMLMSSALNHRAPAHHHPCCRRPLQPGSGGLLRNTYSQGNYTQTPGLTPGAPLHSLLLRALHYIPKENKMMVFVLSLKERQQW